MITSPAVLGLCDIQSITYVGFKTFQNIPSFCSSGDAFTPPRLTDLVKLAQECCYHSNLAFSAHGVTVPANIAISYPEIGGLFSQELQVLDGQSLDCIPRVLFHVLEKQL